MAQQPPLTPEQLQKPALAGDAFLRDLAEQKRRKYAQIAPLYAAIGDGSLERDYLDLWIKDSYTSWDNLYKAAGGIFVKINVEELRSKVLVKMVNIEGKELGRQWNGATTPAYEELWLRFAEGAGVPRAEVLGWKPFSRTHFALTTLALYSKGYEWTWLDGIASLYAGDLFLQESLSLAYEGLRTHYKVPEPALEVFRAVLADVAFDLEWEAKELASLCCTIERQYTAGRAFRERLDIEHQIATGPWLAREVDKGGTRVPTRVP